MPTKTLHIAPRTGCRFCRGTGKVKQRHLPGYTEELLCDCILVQIDDDLDDNADIVIEDDDSWADAAYDSWKERDL